MTDQQPHTPPECDHHWISYMQPSTGLSWIRQCSQCKDFDAQDLQEQIAAAEQRGAVRAFKESANEVRREMRWQYEQNINRNSDTGDSIDRLLELEKVFKYRADQEVDDETN